MAVLALVWVLGRPAGMGSPAVGVVAATATPSETGGIVVSDADVVVHVAGAVRRPGVYTLPGGSRVADAVEAAGNGTDKAVFDGLNLARPLTDGEQVVVPEKGEDQPGSPAPSAGAPASAAPTAGAAATVSLNAATVADLETLPGIGPVLAQRILDYRESIGGFTEIGQLREVPGIGEKTFQALSELVSL